MDDSGTASAHARPHPGTGSVTKAYGWMPLLALAGTVAVEAGERQSLAQAVDDLQTDFGISDVAVAVIPFAMAIVGGLGAVPFGHLADRVRRTMLLAIAMVLWSVAMLMSGFTTGFVALLAARLLVGAVEANGPAAVSLVSDYYPARDRARFMGLYQSGALAGALIGLVAGGVAVEAGGWQWAFWMWVPVGVLVALAMLAQPEPRRGLRELELSAGMDVAALSSAPATAAELELPPPARTGTLDYSSTTTREVYRELTRIPTMWLGLVSLFVSQVLLVALSFWGVEFFKRVHGLDGAQAGGITALLGLGSALGIVGGGFVADRFVRRGHVNARVMVVAVGSIAGGLVLMPAFASTSLVLTAPLFFVGGVFLTLPVAPGEAMVSDVVVAELRGRAAALRSFLRSFAAVGVLVVGGLSEAFGLRWALVLICPTYIVGGLVALAALRTYPRDLAFVVAEARRGAESSSQ